MPETMSTIDLGDEKVPVSSVAPVHDVEKNPPHSLPNTNDESKPQDPLLTPTTPQSPVDDKTLSSSSSSPVKLGFNHSVDEEKQTKRPKKAKKTLEQKKRILDIVQRIVSLILSFIIFAVMAHAYVTFLQNKDVTQDGKRTSHLFLAAISHPSISSQLTSISLRPTDTMITAGAVTVALNLASVIWRIHGTVHDLSLISISQKYYDYVLHGLNFAIWLGTSTSFKISKNWGPAQGPNVLWGYTCSSRATGLSQTSPEIVRFWLQCEIQTVSFWMSVSAYIVEGFGIVAKIFDWYSSHK